MRGVVRCETRLLSRGERCKQQPSFEFKARTALLESASTGGLCCRLCLVTEKGFHGTLMGFETGNPALICCVSLTAKSPYPCHFSKRRPYSAHAMTSLAETALQWSAQ